MRFYIIASLFLGISPYLYAQVGPPIFDNQTILEDGIYTSLEEVLDNSPKYFCSQLNIEIDVWLGYQSILSTDTSGTKQDFEDDIFLVVKDGFKYVFHKDRMQKLIEKGALSTFIARTIYMYDNNYQEMNVEMYFWDLLTGRTYTLTASNLEEFLKRDPTLYNSFTALSRKKKKNSTFRYLLEYNARNPVEMKE